MGLLVEKVRSERLADEHYRLQQRVVAGQVLASLRRSRGVSVKEIVWQAAVSRGYVWHLENGLIRSPDPAKISRIASALGADPDQVCGFFGVLPPDISRWVNRNAEMATRLLRPVVGSR